MTFCLIYRSRNEASARYEKVLERLYGGKTKKLGNTAEITLEPTRQIATDPLNRTAKIQGPKNTPDRHDLSRQGDNGSTGLEGLTLRVLPRVDTASVDALPRTDLPFADLNIHSMPTSSRSELSTETALPGAVLPGTGAETQKVKDLNEFLQRTGHSLVKLRDLMQSSSSTADTELAEALFDLAYEACEKTFGDEDEGLSKDGVRSKLLDPESSWDFILVANPKDATIAAGYVIHTGKVDNIPFSVAEYMWVDPAFRNAGLGSAFVKDVFAQLKSQGIQLHLGEVHDPFLAKVPLYDIMSAGKEPQKKPFNAAAQLGFWKKHGRLIVDTFWPQPAMASGLKEVTKWQLSVHPFNEEIRSLSPKQVLAIWDTFYSRSNPETQADVTSTRAKLVEWLKPFAAQGANVPFLSLDVPRAWSIHEMLRRKSSQPKLEAGTAVS